MRRFIVLLLITRTVWAQNGLDKLVPVLYYEDLSIKGKAFYDAKKDSRIWILYPPVAFSIFVSSIYYGSRLGDAEILGISAASLTIPYLPLR